MLRQRKRQSSPVLTNQLGDLDAFESLFREHQRPFTAGFFASSAIPQPPKTSRSRPSGASIARTTASSSSRPLDLGASHRYPRRPRLASCASARNRPGSINFDQNVSTLPSKSAADPGIAAEIRLKTAQAFARLPPTLRIAALLALIEEQSHKQVALALGISSRRRQTARLSRPSIVEKRFNRQGITP